MILPISLTIAAAAAILNLWLAVRVGRVRIGASVSIGDGGNPVLAARMRAHANFAEYTPFFLILLALVEFAHGSATWLWVLAILYILARISHAFGMDRPAPNPFRMVGIIVTMVALLILAGYALSIPYFAQAKPTTTIVG